MKKLAMLFLAAGLLLGALPDRAAAVEIKASGEWDFNWEWGNKSFIKDNRGDSFAARQRLRTQVDIIASESLSGVVFFEIGDTNWGNGEEGGSLGTDGKVIKVRYSYVDWVVPQTDLRIRMGLQPYALPAFAAGSPILDDADGAGITVAYQINDTVGVSLFWLRGEHGNALNDDGDAVDRGVGDNMDFVGLTLPLSGDGWRLTPWGVYGNLGRNSLIDPSESGDYGDVVTGLLPYGVDPAWGRFLKDNNNPAWWLGMGGELTLFDPLRLALDVSYGRADWGSMDKSLSGFSRDLDLKREGWLAVASVEYKLDLLTPGLIFWYGSGDDSNVADGSERMPTIKPSWTGTSFGWKDAYGIADDGILGLSPVGTWGVIFRLSDISFAENLSHTLALGYYTGTNDEDAVRRGGALFRNAAGADNPFGDSLNQDNVYLTQKDHAWEVDFNSEYKIYENLTCVLELGYIRLDLDDGVWKDVISSEQLDKNAWKIGLNMNYAF